MGQGAGARSVAWLDREARPGESWAVVGDLAHCGRATARGGGRCNARG